MVFKDKATFYDIGEIFKVKGILKDQIALFHDQGVIFKLNLTFTKDHDNF